MRVSFYGNFGVDFSSESHHAKSLEALGHTVTRLQEPRVSADEIAAQDCDVFCWIHTHGDTWETPGIAGALAALRARGIPCITYHLDLFCAIPERWKRYQNHPYLTGLDHWFTVDRLMADWLDENTDTRGHWMPPGVLAEECYISNQKSPHANDLVFVGARGYHRAWTHRQQLLDHLELKYGGRFTRAGGDAPTGTVRGDALNRLYANSKIAVGDTYCAGYDYPDYWSDRVPETLGRGGFLLMPRVPGIEKQFTDGEHLALWEFGDFDDLDAKIAYYLEHEDEREKIRRAGHEHVKATATYKHRWHSILDTVFP